MVDCRRKTYLRLINSLRYQTYFCFLEQIQVTEIDSLPEPNPLSGISNAQMGCKNQNLQLRIIISLLANIERYRVEFARRIDQFFVTNHNCSSVRSDRTGKRRRYELNWNPPRTANCERNDGNLGREWIAIPVR